MPGGTQPANKPKNCKYCARTLRAIVVIKFKEDFKQRSPAVVCDYCDRTEAMTLRHVNVEMEP